MKARFLYTFMIIAITQIVGHVAFAANDTVQVPGSVMVKKGETVGDAVSICGNVLVKGHVTGDAVSVAGNVLLEPGATVDGDTVSVLGNVMVEPGATVNGEAVAVGGTVLTKPGGVIHGSTTNVGGWRGLRFLPWQTNSFFFLRGIWGTIVYALILAGLAALVVALFPTKMEMVADYVIQQPGKSALYGILWIFLAPTITMIFVMTAVGIPLAILVVIAIIVAAIISGVCAALAVGKRLNAAFNRPAVSSILAAFVGVLLIQLVRLVPLLGFLLVAILYTMAFGAAIMTGFGTNTEWFADLFRRRAPVPASPASTVSQTGGDQDTH